MTDSDLSASAAPAPASAGVLLRAAREAAGMSIDAVAQQLKLAPRQVKALEDGDFTRLPGRTFVRGFMRSYARLLRLDPDAILGALPAAGETLDSPALHATAPTIGELPTAEPARHGWTRWAIPLTLVAIIGATAAWEWMYPAAESPRSNSKEIVTAPERHISAAGTPETIGTPLPNPVAPMAAPAAAERSPTAEPVPATVPSNPVAQPAADASPASLPIALAPTAADAPLMLAFRDFSWTEVRDRSGRVLLSRMNPGGSTQSIAGPPPLDIVIGNAADVTLTWKGRRVDLTPHTRQNVARLTLE